MEPTTISLRAQIARAFSSEELTELCFDHFPAVYDTFTAGMTKNRMIQLLLDYCVHHQVEDTLLNLLEHNRPGLIGTNRPVLLSHLQRDHHNTTTLSVSSVTRVFHLINAVFIYLSEYLHMLMTTLTTPDLLFQPITASREYDYTANTNKSAAPVARINPKIIPFFLTSVCIGLTISRCIPGMGTLPEIHVSLLIIISFWIFFGCINHIVCRSLGGKGRIEQTISLSIQLSSAIYVLNIFFTLFASIVALPLVSHYLLIYYDRHISFDPIDFLFLFRYILVVAYSPLAFHRIHRFRRWAFIIFIFVFLLIIQPSYTYINVQIWETNGLPGGSGGGHG